MKNGNGAFPELVAECQRQWGLTLGEPFHSSRAFVAPARTAAGSEAVLKIGSPNAETRSEIAALRIYAGDGAVCVIEANEQRGCFLLERAWPGQSLAEVADDEEATRIAARVMRSLWQGLADDHEFPTAAAWSAGLQRLRAHFHGGTGPFAVRLVERAEALFEELLASSAPPVLVHGDLHHGNILSAHRLPWLAIDPKGLSAEPAYEVGALLRNPSPMRWSDKLIQQRRIDILHDELGIDKDRITKWAAAQAILSGWWSYEDGEPDWEAGGACAETLLQLL